MYKDIFEALRFLDDLVVTGPQFLARKLHEPRHGKAPEPGCVNLWETKRSEEHLTSFVPQLLRS